MWIIKSKNTVLGTIYEKTNGKKTIIQQTGAIGFIKDYRGKKHFIITYLSGEPIDKANYYLNEHLSTSSYKVREMAFSALKIFFSYISLNVAVPYETGLDKQEVASLVNFIKGGLSKGTNWTLDVEVRRSNKTVNAYLSVYRDFYKHILKVDDSYLHEKKAINISRRYRGFMAHTNKSREQVYKSALKIAESSLVPKYIKEAEYEKIIETVKGQYSIRDQIIIKLMYEYSLRIGEVLGLTLEDIEETEEPDVYRLLLRNRASDKPWQLAKNLFQPSEQEQYETEEYNTKKIGYHVIYIDDEMKELIEDYIDEVWDEKVLSKSKKKKVNLQKLALADSVTGLSNIYNDANYYIFLNHGYFTPLTQSGWNKVLRQILSSIGIKVDEKVRKDNLNHRFRHGFAMNKVKNERYSHLELAEALRHSGIESVKIYYNPDEEEYIRLLRTQREQHRRGSH
ncbi:tyrosine-type recombinase/integrase [Priestia megaterium]